MTNWECDHCAWSYGRNGIHNGRNGTNGASTYGVHHCRPSRCFALSIKLFHDDIPPTRHIHESESFGERKLEFPSKFDIAPIYRYLGELALTPRQRINAK